MSIQEIIRRMTHIYLMWLTRNNVKACREFMALLDELRQAEFEESLSRALEHPND